MNVLLISEHYFPKIGGTVSYVENTAVNLAKKGINVYLLIPALGQLGTFYPKKYSENNLTLLHLGVSDNQELYYNASERTYFCSWVRDNIFKITKQYDIDIVHLLFGLFLAEALNTDALHKLGIKTYNTIHNIPPFECSNSWKEDKFFLYYKDEIRKLGVRLINKKRIQKNEFDFYITPSNIVKDVLSKYVPSTKIHVIGHGGAEYIKPRESKPTSRINILTVGGLVPHKNQHLIPSISKYLKQEKINFKWDIVGPIRNQRYVNAIKKEISDLDLEGTVFLNTHVNDNKLTEFYNEASLYIQPSSEEGFCMTVLDAIAYGIPVLGTPAGAIPEMLEMSGGTVVEPHLDMLKPIIAHYVKIINTLQVDSHLLTRFKNTFTWENAAEQLIQLYNE